MPQEELVLRLARQYLNDSDYRDLVGLLNLFKHGDSSMKSIAQAELMNKIQELITKMETELQSKGIDTSSSSVSQP